jgi:hypothetical protein
LNIHNIILNDEKDLRRKQGVKKRKRREIYSNTDARRSNDCCKDMLFNGDESLFLHVVDSILN